MSAQGGGRPSDQGSSNKATVDRRRVFGGMAGVVAALLSVLGGVRDLVPLTVTRVGGIGQPVLEFDLVVWEK